MAAECEIEVKSGNCAVMAIGRCVRCEKAFCASHQALQVDGVIINLCSVCSAQDQARNRESLLKGLAPSPNWEEAARQLAAANVPAISLHAIRYVKKNSLLGSRTVEETIPLGRAWILGNVHFLSVSVLTALREHVNMAGYASYGYLVRVVPDPGHQGYRIDSDAHHVMTNVGEKEAFALVQGLLAQANR